MLFDNILIEPWYRMVFKEQEAVILGNLKMNSAYFDLR